MKPWEMRLCLKNNKRVLVSVLNQLSCGRNSRICALRWLLK